MSAIKPVKRSQQLAPLSREHHDALLFTWKIKQGLNNGTSPGEIGLYVQWYWNNFLQHHFFEEESLLLPHLPAIDKLVRQLKTEHEEIKGLIAGPLDKASLAILAETINDHIRFEERQLFPHVEQKLSPDQLNSIYSQLNQEPHCNEKWENEFWMRKK